MPATVRRLKINKRFESAACCWCGDALALGQHGAICEACESPHHAGCWDRENGCNGDRACVNRPLHQIPNQPQPVETPHRPLAPGETFCSSCGDIVTGLCYRCNPTAVSGYSGVIRGTVPEADEALRYAIIGLFCFGVILGPIAFVKATKAKQLIAQNPMLDGAGKATAAQILAVIEVLLYVTTILRALGGN